MEPTIKKIKPFTEGMRIERPTLGMIEHAGARSFLVYESDEVAIGIFTSLPGSRGVRHRHPGATEVAGFMSLDGTWEFTIYPKDQWHGDPKAPPSAKPYSGIFIVFPGPYRYEVSKEDQEKAIEDQIKTLEAWKKEKKHFKLLPP